MTMQNLKVSDELHDSIKRYCVLNRIKIEQFVSETFESNDKLLKFKQQVKAMKFS